VKPTSPKFGGPCSYKLFPYGTMVPSKTHSVQGMMAINGNKAAYVALVTLCVEGVRSQQVSGAVPTSEWGGGMGVRE
jgi:hypothetical protein